MCISNMFSVQSKRFLFFFGSDSPPSVRVSVDRLLLLSVACCCLRQVQLTFLRLQQPRR